MVSLASSIASSASRTFITGITGPKVSSRITFIEWSTSAITVGSYQSPGAVLALAAGEDAGARRARVLDVVGDDLDLGRRGHRADLGRVGVGRRRPGAASSTFAASLSTNSS